MLMLLVLRPNFERATTLNKWIDPPGNYLISSIWVLFFSILEHEISLMWVRFLPPEKRTNNGLFSIKVCWYRSSIQTPSLCLYLTPVQGTCSAEIQQCSTILLQSSRESPKANFTMVFGLSNLFTSLHFMLLSILMNTESH